jgi:hypothetical protein
MTLERLQQRLKRAHQGWDRAMSRPGYRDDPDEAASLGDPPFSDDDWRLYWWADTWRLEVHQLENQIDATPEAAAFRALHGSSRVTSDPTYIEAEHALDVVARHIGVPTKSAPKPKTVRRAK